VAFLKRNDVGKAYAERLKELKGASNAVSGPRPGA